MCLFPGELADMTTACENALCVPLCLTGVACVWGMVISVYFFKF